MIKLSNLKVNQILTKFANEHPQIELTESQIVDTQTLYDRLMNEKLNQTKNTKLKLKKLVQHLELTNI